MHWLVVACCFLFSGKDIVDIYALAGCCVLFFIFRQRHCRYICIGWLLRVVFLFSGKDIVDTRGDQKVRGKHLPFLHRLMNRAGITAHNTATHIQLIGTTCLM